MSFSRIRSRQRLTSTPLPPLVVVFRCFRPDTRDTSRVAASEVSSILESRIAGTSVGANVEETGRVLSECDALEFMAGGVAE